jgi:hypothetical protein
LKKSQIVGACLMVIGMFMTIIGYAQYGSVSCNCPAQIAGQPSNCHCGENSGQIIGHIIAYVGLAIVGGGIILFAYAWRKSNRKLGINE